MTTDRAASAHRASRALCQQMSDRLTVDDRVNGNDIYRATKTLEALFSSMPASGLMDENLAADIERLMVCLTVRVGESIDGGDGDDVYELGRAIGVVNGIVRQNARLLA